MLNLLIEAAEGCGAEPVAQGSAWSALIMIFMLFVGIPGMIIGIVALIKLINRRIK